MYHSTYNKTFVFNLVLERLSFGVGSNRLELARLLPYWSPLFVFVFSRLTFSFILIICMYLLVSKFGCIEWFLYIVFVGKCIVFLCDFPVNREGNV